MLRKAHYAHNPISQNLAQMLPLFDFENMQMLVWLSHMRSLTDNGPVSSFQIIQCRSLAAAFFTPLSSRRLMVWLLWCPRLCARRYQGRCLKLINTSVLSRCKPLIMVALPTSLSQLVISVEPSWCYFLDYCKTARCFWSRASTVPRRREEPSMSRPVDQ